MQHMRMYISMKGFWNRIALQSVSFVSENSSSPNCAAAAPPPSGDDAQEEAAKRALAFMGVLMAILGATLSVAGLERLIRGRFTLFSMVRVLLRCTFLLFLPLLSYMLSKAEEEGRKHELLYFLLWMLLIELIRKKVHAMVESADGSFSRAAGRFRLKDHSDEATRLVWIGYLIYSHVKHQNTLLMALFVILWSLALAKLGQRMINKWKAQDSLAASGSTHVIAGYMQQVVAEAEGASTAVLKNCKYVVMGEEKLVLGKKDRQRKVKSATNSKVLVTPHCGYGVGRFPHYQDEQKHAHLLIDLSKVKDLVTVDKIWQNLPTIPRVCCLLWKREPQFREHLRHLSLSFSLFKLLRRRFEHYPMVEAGSDMARRLMLEGLLALKGTGSAHEEGNAHEVFQVLQLEVDFLDNYYQAGVPVVMSAPWLFIFNFLYSILFVFIYLIAVLVIMIFNYLQCQTVSMLYLGIAILLVITLLAIEVTELLTVYVLSNWFLVHLLCLYSTTGKWLWNFLCRPIIRFLIAGRFLLFCALRLVFKLFGRSVDTKKVKVRQVSILQVCEPVYKMLVWASQVTLATKAKVQIVRSLKGIDPLGDCNVCLPQIDGLDSRGKTATEVILQSHLATELLDIRHGKQEKKKKKEQQAEDDHRTIATTLSRYCMYLVARAPELLPDDERWVSDRYDDMRRCLKKASRRCCCGSAWQSLLDMDAEAAELLQDTAVWGGVKLFQRHRERADKDKVWEEMACFWVDLLVYLAPANDVEGHAMALASSGTDLITCLWAFCTHAGIRRRDTDASADQV